MYMFVYLNGINIHSLHSQSNSSLTRTFCDQLCVDHVTNACEKPDGDSESTVIVTHMTYFISDLQILIKQTF